MPISSWCPRGTCENFQDFESTIYFYHLSKQLDQNIVTTCIVYDTFIQNSIFVQGTHYTRLPKTTQTCNVETILHIIKESATDCY